MNHLSLAKLYILSIIGVAAVFILQNGAALSGPFAILSFSASLISPFLLFFHNTLPLFFRAIHKQELKLLSIAPLIELLVTLYIALTITTFGYQLATNPGADSLVSIQAHLLHVSQIFAENLWYMGTFLALFLTIKRYTSIPPVWTITITTLAAGIFFGLLHFNTYAGNLTQIILLIGITSSIQVLLYIRTRNILVPFLAHLLYNLLLFGITLIPS